jgi:hypothetical protein
MDLREIETRTTHRFFNGEFSFHVRKSKIVSICLRDRKLGYRHVSLHFSNYHTPIPLLPLSVEPYLCTLKPYCYTLVFPILAQELVGSVPMN